jgi:integrase
MRQDTLTGFLDWWLPRKKKHLKASTYQGYEKIVNHRIIPRFKGRLLAQLIRRDFRDWFDELDVSNKTLRNIQSCLRSALNDAVDEEIIPANPMAGWTYQRRETVGKVDDVDPFSADEQAAILSALTGQARNLIQFAFWTGLRTSELVAVDWNDIDWSRGEIRISRAMTQAAAEPETTKTAAGTRSVKLLRPAREALEAQKQFTLEAKEIFQNPRTGERWTGDQAIRKTLWTPALKRAAVRYRRPYQTRHTYASMMLSAGEHPMWVAQQMGHRDWGMIRTIYGRWMPSEDSESGVKAEAAFAQAKDPDER